MSDRLNATRHALKPCTTVSVVSPADETKSLSITYSIATLLVVGVMGGHQPYYFMRHARFLFFFMLKFTHLDTFNPRSAVRCNTEWQNKGIMFVSYFLPAVSISKAHKSDKLPEISFSQMVSKLVAKIIFRESQTILDYFAKLCTLGRPLRYKEEGWQCN